jgi:hypothetical protein
LNLPIRHLSPQGDEFLIILEEVGLLAIF